MNPILKIPRPIRALVLLGASTLAAGLLAFVVATETVQAGAFVVLKEIR